MRTDQIIKYEAYVKEIKERRKRLLEELSLVDKKRADVLHFLELEKYDAVMMAKAAKKLKVLSQERRIIKEEISVVAHIYDKISKPIPQKIYKPATERYSTDVVNDLFMNKKGE